MNDNQNHYSELVGQKLFLRTVTYHVVGEVTGVLGSMVTLKDASWVADSGRFGKAITTGEMGSGAEVEYLGDAYVNLDSVTDMYPWAHALPTETR
jgi:hypothetical protein